MNILVRSSLLIVAALHSFDSYARSAGGGGGAAGFGFGLGVRGGATAAPILAPRGGGAIPTVRGGTVGAPRGNPGIIRSTSGILQVRNSVNGLRITKIDLKGRTITDVVLPEYIVINRSALHSSQIPLIPATDPDPAVVAGAIEDTPPRIDAKIEDRLASDNTSLELGSIFTPGATLFQGDDGDVVITNRPEKYLSGKGWEAVGEIIVEHGGEFTAERMSTSIPKNYMVKFHSGLKMRADNVVREPPYFAIFLKGKVDFVRESLVQTVWDLDADREAIVETIFDGEDPYP